jgi:hypothetical protein
MASRLLIVSVGGVGFTDRQHPAYTVSDAVRMMLRLTGILIKRGARERARRAKCALMAGLPGA